MLFNSFDFAVFLPIVFALYWWAGSKQKTLQNGIIVAASYFFYGCWDWRFLGLILASSLIDYTIGLQLVKTQAKSIRKRLLWISILANIGMLGVFKYFDFFASNFSEAFTLLGIPFEAASLGLILPVGISFYTFQTLSYTIDIYRNRITPTKNLLAFMAFVSFFPQLVAGPIERASHLLPQFLERRVFSRKLAVDGLRQILWGLFKKIVIADNCARFANLCFNNPDQYNGSALLLGAVFFSFQIYGDFSGYSDIAIGTSRLFGFDLKQNFAFPYFSRNIAEFWRRWHISLSTWFRDYLYIPLGGSQGGTKITVRNVFIVFLVSGFWHGANWTFLVWGGLHALCYLPLVLVKRNRKYLDQAAKGRKIPHFRELFSMLLTFTIVLLLWVFFRASSMSDAWEYLGGMATTSLFSIPNIYDAYQTLILIGLVVFLLLFEWNARDKKHALEGLSDRWSSPVRYGFYYLVVFFIFWFGGEPQEFIYFQF